MSIPLFESLLLLSSLVFATLWFSFYRLSEHFRMFLFVCSIIAAFFVSTNIVYWTEVVHTSLTPMPYIGLLIMCSVIGYAWMHHWIGQRQGLFFLLSTLFPFLLGSVAINSLIGGDIYLTFAFFLVFCVSGLLLLRDSMPKIPLVVVAATIGMLAVIRLFGIKTVLSETGTVDVDAIAIPMVFVFAGLLAAGVVFFPVKKLPTSFWPKRFNPTQLPRWIEHSMLGVLVVVAVVLSTVNLGGMNFQNDEYYHVEAAQGLIAVGDFVRWDFTQDVPLQHTDGSQVRYTRAAVYTVQTAVMARLFGLTEAVARFPSVLWYLVSIVGSYFVLRRWRKDALFAFLMVLTFLFFDQFVMHARMVRMYSMHMAIAGAMILLWYHAYQYSVDKKAQLWKAIGWIVLAGMVSLVAIAVHWVTLIFFPAFVVFIGVQLLSGYAEITSSTQRLQGYSHIQTQRTALWLLGFLVIGWSGLVASQLLHIDLPSQFIGLRGAANISYELLPFTDLPLVLFGVGLYLVGVVYSLHRGVPERYLAIITLGVICTFVFGVQRYNAFRYILFLTPFILTVAGDMLYQWLQQLSLLLKKGARPWFIAGCFVLVFVPLSIPGAQAGLLFETARADRVHANGYDHNFGAAYTYIREHRTEDEVVFAQSFRTYYWQNDPQLIVLDLGENDLMSLTKLKRLMKEHNSGWLVWADGKTHHLQKRVQTFIENKTEAVHEKAPELQGTNMRVYHYRWKDVK